MDKLLPVAVVLTFDLLLAPVHRWSTRSRVKLKQKQHISINMLNTNLNDDKLNNLYVHIR